MKQFVFTWALVVNLQPLGHDRRYCFEFEVDALDALNTWVGNDHPPGRWIKCKGARVEFLNPEIFNQA